jgi:hypothetical protein
MAVKNCIDTLLFGEVCDGCDGGAILKVVAACIKILSAGILVAATIALIVCGVMIITSRDNASQIAKAKKRMIDIIIGVVIYALMFTILNFIIPGGIVESTTDTTTTSCPDKTSLLGDQDGDGDGDDDGEDDGEGDDDKPSGKYPMAHVEGEKSPGNIKCPRNADYKYIPNPFGKAGNHDRMDDFFQSQANSCPFTEVKYTKNAQDLACDAGGKMHYVADRKWCIVNSKIDVFQYQQYLLNNGIKQDGKTCSASNPSDCKYGGSNENVDKHYSDWGACYYFSITFATNMNNGEVVSNDAYAAQAGYPNHHAFWGRTSFGTETVTWNGRAGLVRYNDNLTGIVMGGATPSGPTGGLAQLRQGQAVGYGVHSTRVDPDPNKNCGHYMAAVGFTMDCAGGKSCNANSIVVMNTDGKISTLGASNYRSGYRRLCSGP